MDLSNDVSSNTVPVHLQVNREAKTDCALAELYTKSLATEQMLQEQKQAEVLTKLYVRLNEVPALASLVAPSPAVCIAVCVQYGTNPVNGLHHDTYTEMLLLVAMMLPISKA